ncbi:unannotated protein [freshwater metagenome]|uniref:Unannotated protein n=1 Tax=freshwater metagenome TaxID=449393 RepID=A0A6J7AHE7_9ZZZZ|nr:hypothetical protein [Actinomycetota bacterium]
MRKLASISVAFIVTAGILTAAPASGATISNGVACKKLNQTTKVDGRKYKCAKNPLSTSTKLTWLSNDCLLSANGYVKAKKDSAAIAAKYAAQIPVIDLGIANETANRTEIQAKLDAASLRLPVAKADLAAATNDEAKKKFGEAVINWTAAIRAYTSKINQIALTIRTLETAKTTALRNPIDLASSIADSKSTALLICTKGL